MRTKHFLLALLSIATLATGGCMSAPSSGNGAESWNMTTPLISMTGKPPTRGLTSLGEVTATYCTSEGEALTRMGILDEVTKKALQLKPGATYLANAKFKNKGMSCVEVFATAAK